MSEHRCDWHCESDCPGRPDENDPATLRALLADERARAWRAMEKLEHAKEEIRRTEAERDAEHDRAEGWKSNSEMHIATLDRVRELRDEWAQEDAHVREVLGRTPSIARALKWLDEALEGGES